MGLIPSCICRQQEKIRPDAAWHPVKDLWAVQLSHLLAHQPLKFRETTSPRVVFSSDMFNTLNESFLVDLPCLGSPSTAQCH